MNEKGNALQADLPAGKQNARLMVVHLRGWLRRRGSRPVDGLLGQHEFSKLLINKTAGRGTSRKGVHVRIFGFTHACLVIPGILFAGEEKPRYKNPALPVEERVADLLGRMTLEEKVGQLVFSTARTPALLTTTGILSEPRIPPFSSTGPVLLAHTALITANPPVTARNAATAYKNTCSRRRVWVFRFSCSTRPCTV
ncbi:MAG: hypothetical protein ONB48_21205 [candidate division KSB1 bacterium]|nr:hypothetical protein [candidate division KSB1 bacterium]MDZ7288168.1 hypothetical protein [candidate division KSB1 bacterium]MDZ7300319.1 hypothetical protein [candidate division KSB1 bacterium]MDZ7308675.1 hypothetical protein [candidate division KSB1 bacterium]MDZ7351319.1 hypothetical protein [candidate division KSB1 bacterium]